MKAVRRPDGSVEFEGTDMEIARAFGLHPPHSSVSAADIPTPAAASNGHATAGAVRQQPNPREPGVRLPGSLPGRVEEFIVAHPDRVFALSDLATALGVTLKAVSAAANRASRAELNRVVENAGRGRYRAIQKGKPA